MDIFDELTKIMIREFALEIATFGIEWLLGEQKWSTTQIWLVISICQLLSLQLLYNEMIVINANCELINDKFTIESNL